MSYHPGALQPTRYLPSPVSSPIKEEIVKTTPINTLTVEDFKIPALPRYRLMTPSSSTIAANTSPVTSPIKRTIPTRELYLESDKITVIGRHRNHPTSSIPTSLSTLLVNPTKRVESVHLPRTAQHASRIHCMVEYVSEGSMRLVVVGQNGVRVRYQGKVIRMKKGEIREFEESLEVDFFGSKLRLLQNPILPPSSPPEMELETVDVVDEKPPIDLPALLASTVVFSGSSKLSLPDLVKHMLEAQPSLRDLGTEPQWYKWASEELEGNQMFGKVQRHGKDSSGHPLLPHYFYVPDADPDMSRAKQLGGLVRPLRAAQRAGGKAIDWRPVGSGRRRY